MPCFATPRKSCPALQPRLTGWLRWRHRVGPPQQLGQGAGHVEAAAADHTADESGRLVHSRHQRRPVKGQVNQFGQPHHLDQVLVVWKGVGTSSKICDMLSCSSAGTCAEATRYNSLDLNIRGGHLVTHTSQPCPASSTSEWFTDRDNQTLALT